MKKHLLVVAAATALVPLTSSAQAQSAALLVKGTVSPSACTPTLTNGGVLNWGAIPADTLSYNAPTHLLPKTIDFSIACSAATSIAIRTVDNSAATRVPGIALTREGGVAPNEAIYGLGAVAGKNIGAYTVRDYGAATTGTASLATLVQNGGGAWRLHPGNALMASTSRYTWAAEGSASPNPGAHKNLSIPLEITPTLNKRSELPIGNAFTLNGSVSIELDYLS